MKKQIILLGAALSIIALAGCNKATGSTKKAEVTDTPVVEQSMEEAKLETTDASEYAMAIQNIVASKDLYAFADQVKYPVKVAFPDETCANADELKALDMNDVLNDSFAVAVVSADASKLTQNGDVYTCGSDERYFNFKWSEEDKAFFITEIVNPK